MGGDTANARSTRTAGKPASTGSTALRGTPGAGHVLTAYLQRQATEFLRSLRLHRESAGAGSGGEESAEAARALRGAGHRIGSALHTFRPLLDPEWSDLLRAELAWLSGTLGCEHASAARLERLLTALQRLSGAAVLPAPRQPSGTSGSASTGCAAARTGAGASTGVRAGTGGGARLGSGAGHGTGTDTGAGLQAGAGSDGKGAGGTGMPRAGTGAGAGVLGGPASEPPPAGILTVGAAKAGALLERQLTLARTRAHSSALQALGSSRFHAVADRVAVLASEVPLAPGTTDGDLEPLAAEAEVRLAEAVAALPLYRAGHPYNTDALLHGLAAEPSPQSQDSPWHQVRRLLRLHRYAREVLAGTYADPATGPATASFREAVVRGAEHGRADAPCGPPAGPGPCGTETADLRLVDAGSALERHRDAAKAAAAAATAARTPRIAPATAYALGVLHADQRHEVEAARFAFQDVWLREAVSPR